MTRRGICGRLIPMAFAALIASGVVACTRRMTVDMPQYKPGRGNVFRDVASRRVAVEVHYAPGAAGSRETRPALGQPVRNVSFLPTPGDLVRQLLESELAAGGHEVVKDSAEILLVANVDRFDIRTESTPIRWDVFGEVSVRIARTSSNYRARCVKKTYDEPVEPLIAALFVECLARIGTQFRSDFAVARLLASPGATFAP